MPTAMFLGFSGGIEHWGTICGALVAPIALIGGVVSDKKIRSEMINELMAWYIQFPFPEYQPAGLNLVKVPVGSTLCHISVSTWCNAEGVSVSASSKEKKERCAGLTSDVVKKTVQMLNSFAETGTFAAVHKPDPIVATCMGCHTDAAPFTQTKENCMSCHGSKLIDIEKCGTHKGIL
jgi:hypothetical protein